MEKKSANKKWKESGTTLSFKEWIDLENKKSEPAEGTFIPFAGDDEWSKKSVDGFSVPVIDISAIKDTIDTSKEEISQSSGYKPLAHKSTVLGLDTKILVFSGIVILGSLGFYYYTKIKKKNG